MITDQMQVEKGLVLFDQGESATKLFFLVEGVVDLFQVVQGEMKPEGKKEFLVGEINPGELFGLSALIMPFQYTVLAKTSSISTILTIDGLKLRTEVEQDTVLGYKLIHQVARQLMERITAVRTQLAASWT
jgi:CRP-like cAMP-binding protein